MRHTYCPILRWSLLLNHYIIVMEPRGIRECKVKDARYLFIWSLEWPLTSLPSLPKSLCLNWDRSSRENVHYVRFIAVVHVHRCQQWQINQLMWTPAFHDYDCTDALRGREGDRCSTRLHDINYLSALKNGFTPVHLKLGLRISSGLQIRYK